MYTRFLYVHTVCGYISQYPWPWPRDLFLQEPKPKSTNAVPDATVQTPARLRSESIDLHTPSPAIRKNHTFEEDTPSASKPPAPRRQVPQRQDTIASLFLGSEEGDTPQRKQERKTSFTKEEKEQINAMTSCKALSIARVFAILGLYVYILHT